MKSFKSKNQCVRHRYTVAVIWEYFWRWRGQQEVSHLHRCPWSICICTSLIAAHAYRCCPWRLLTWPHGVCMVGVSSPLHRSPEWNLRAAFIDWWEFTQLGGAPGGMTQTHITREAHLMRSEEHKHTRTQTQMDRYSVFHNLFSHPHTL